MKWIIFDLDGTVACSKHRSHHLRGMDLGGHDIDWDAWDADTLNDSPIGPVLHVLDALRTKAQMDDPDGEDEVGVMFLTARGERARALTTQWLHEQDAYFPEYGDMLVMRGLDDTRPDTVIKRELIETMRAEGHEFLFAFEDRRLVANMLRELGIFVFHVADYD